MILSLIIIVYLLFMGFWWGSQGFFSALLHLVATICAGALALALWEPLALQFMGRFAEYSWAGALMGPFILFLLVIRVALDKIVNGNVNFSVIVNWIFGPLCGLFAGILTAGLVVIALGFLPLGNDLLGYEPFTLDATKDTPTSGKVAGETNRTMLWPVHSQTVAFYTMLSDGAFFSGDQMSVYLPDLAAQSARHRLRQDPNSSVVAPVRDVSVTDVWAVPTPATGLDTALIKVLPGETMQVGKKIVVVETEWKASTAGGFDSDQAIRIPSPQVRLLAGPSMTEGSASVEFEPLGFTTVDGTVKFVPFNDAATMATAVASPAKFRWAFLIPSDYSPRFITLRHTRFTLHAEPNKSIASLAKAIGTPQGVTPQVANGGNLFDPAKTGAPTPKGVEGMKADRVATEIAINANLPRPISRNLATSLTLQENRIVSGEGTIRRNEGSIPRNLSIDEIDFPKHQVCVRVGITKDKANSIYGAARSVATSVTGTYLLDAKGGQHWPIGYALYKPISGETLIKFVDDRNSPLRSGRELPIDKMEGEEVVYIYFAVPKGVGSITTFQIGTQTKQQVEPPLAIPG